MNPDEPDEPDELSKSLSRWLPPRLAWALAPLAWPLKKLIEIAPQIVTAVLNYRVETKKIEIEQEKWQIQKASILKKIESKRQSRR